MKKNLIWIILVILFSIPAIAALFHPGFFQSDDGEWMVIRFSAFHQALRDGEFPVRFLSRLNYGYGYPVSNFLYPGFMYLGELFKLLGFGFVQTIKIIFGLSMVGSAVFAYLWLSKLFDRWPSFVGSFLYLYAPYHLFDIYKRGSVGEVLTLGLVPFIFWQIERKSFFWTSLGIAFLIVSHNTLALLFLPVVILYLLARGLAFSVYLLPSVLLGLGISSFFWIPAIFDLQYTVFQNTPVSDWSNHFADFTLVGFVPQIVFILTLFTFKKFKDRISILMFSIGIVSLFLSLSISSLVSEWLPVSVFQFPFRFLSVTILSAAFLSAFLLNEIKANARAIFGVAILIVGFLSASYYISPSVFFDKGDAYYSTNEDTTTVKSEYMPKWVKNNPTEHFANKVEIVNGLVTDLKIKSNRVRFLATSDNNSLVTINTIYFPGWKVVVDGKAVPIPYENHSGIMQFNVAKGAHLVEASFSETRVRLIGDIVSLVSLGALLLLCLVI